MSLTTYEDYVSVEDAQTFKRVKVFQMRLAEAGRNTVSEILNKYGIKGKIQTEGKHFLTVGNRKYRMSMGPDSDNSTEIIAHEEMGAIPVVMGDAEELGTFFAQFGLDPKKTVAQFKRKLTAYGTKG